MSGASRFELSIHADLGKAYVPSLRRHLRAARAALRDAALRDVSLAMVNDATMSDLHEQYLGLAGPTDVLTFELDHNESNEVIAGEIILCVPQARRQARIRRTSIQNELLLYGLHGMLHLCGFDDRTARGYKAMHRAEDDILTRLGIGPVFQPAVRPRLSSRPRAKTPRLIGAR